MRVVLALSFVTLANAGMSEGWGTNCPSTCSIPELPFLYEAIPAQTCDDWSSFSIPSHEAEAAGCDCSGCVSTQTACLNYPTCSSTYVQSSIPNQCEEGTFPITDANICEQAAYRFDVTRGWGGTINYYPYPAGCYIAHGLNDGYVFFNSHPVGSDYYSPGQYECFVICEKPDTYAPTPAPSTPGIDATFAMLPAGSYTCEGSMLDINTVTACVQAGEQLGLLCPNADLERTARNRPNAPAGCYAEADSNEDGTVTVSSWCPFFNYYQGGSPSSDYFRLCQEEPKLSVCADDSEWYFKAQSKNCAWVAANPTKRCKKKGRDADGKKVKASKACLDACDKCCADSDTWFFKKEKKNCAWVAKNAKRCNKKGTDGDEKKVYGRIACPVACGTCPETRRLLLEAKLV